MLELSNTIWIETRKAVRSRMPLWTAIASLFMPVGIALMIFAAKNPQISQKLGIVSAKANLVALSATDWSAYLSLYGQIIAVGGFILYVLILAWVFGREFVDGTVKDLLAVPVPRGSILLGKFIVASAWSLLISLIIVVVGLIMGTFLVLPAGSPEVFRNGSGVLAICALLALAIALPFALLASVGRGYFLPFGVAILIVMVTNLVVVAGWGDVFPWAIPGLYSMGKTTLTPLSIGIVAVTGLAGMLATYLWWKYTDQNR
jgi:ABC-2 type transport system permease protein